MIGERTEALLSDVPTDEWPRTARVGRIARRVCVGARCAPLCKYCVRMGRHRKLEAL